MTRTLGQPGRRSSLTFRIASVVVLCALGARQVHADSEKIAVHPLVVPEVSEKEELEYQKLFRAEVARREPGVAAAAQVRAFLKGLPHQTCVSATDLDACLAQLAKGIGARRAVFVSLYVYPRIRFSGRVVRDTGELRVSAQKEYGRKPRKKANEAIRRALQDFLVAELRLGKPDSQPSAQASTTAEKPPGPEEREATSSSTDSRQKEVMTEPVLAPKEVLTEPALPPPIDMPIRSPETVAVGTSVEASEGWSWQKTSGVSLLSAGSVATGLGIYFRIQASSAWSDFNSFSRQTTLLSASQISSLKSIQSRAQSRQTAGNLLLIAGSTMAVVGATILIVDLLTKPAPLSSMSVAVVPYPVGLSVTGGF